MASISSGIAMDSNIMNLKEINIRDVRPEVPSLMLDNEKIIMAFQTVRDQVVFTDRRIFVVNVQGLSGKKVSYFSYPYSSISLANMAIASTSFSSVLSALS